MLNKFRGPKDPGFQTVSNYIAKIVENLIRTKDKREESLARIDVFVNSFDFPDMDTRYKDIAIPFNKTLIWLFQPPARDDDTNKTIPTIITNHILEASNAFISWATSRDPSNNLFWISGKAGAGKSTLMKFLIGDARTEALLQGSWGGTQDHPPILLHHCFLLLGSPKQRSKTGMMRTLLSQLLKVLRRDGQDMAILQDTYRTPVPSAPQRILAPDAWTESEQESILAFALGKVVATRLVCILIDGLDEFDPADGPRPLLDLIFKLRDISGVRIIVSSRPEPLLQQSLCDFPHFSLQELTAVDMYLFARDKLGDILDRQDLVESLALKLVENAEGVFLWTALVVKNMVEDIRSKPAPAEEVLMQRIDELPRDMMKLYDSIWNRRNRDTPSHREEAADYFHLMLVAKRTLRVCPGHRFRYWAWQGTTDSQWTRDFTRGEVSLLHLALARDTQIAKSMLTNPSGIGSAVVLSQCEAVRGAILTRCAGILEVTSTEKGKLDPECSVKFIHRSAEEFLQQTDEGQAVLSHSDSNSTQRVDRTIVAALARSHAFRSVVNEYGVCHELAPSDIHETLAKVGIMKDRYFPDELRQMVAYCRLLLADKVDCDPLSNENIYWGKSVDIIGCGLDILFWPQLLGFMALGPAVRARVLQFASALQIESWDHYGALLKWLDKHGFTNFETQTEVARSPNLAASQTHTEQALSATLGSFKPWLLRDYLANLARFTLAEGFSTSEIPVWMVRQTGLLGKLTGWERKIYGREGRSWYGFCFVRDDGDDDSKTPTSSPARQCFFNQLIPTPLNLNHDNYVIFFSFPLIVGYLDFFKSLTETSLKKALEGWLAKQDLSFRGFEKVEIEAVGYVKDPAEWGRRRWKVRSVAGRLDLSLPLGQILSGQETSRRKQVAMLQSAIEDPKPEDAMYLADYLAERGLTYKDSE